MKNLSSFSPPQVMPNPYENLSSVKLKIFWPNSWWSPLTSIIWKINSMVTINRPVTTFFKKPLVFSGRKKCILGRSHLSKWQNSRIWVNDPFKNSTFNVNALCSWLCVGWGLHRLISAYCQLLRCSRGQGGMCTLTQYITNLKRKASDGKLEQTNFCCAIH